jgi:hypothetical protein
MSDRMAFACDVGATRESEIPGVLVRTDRIAQGIGTVKAPLLRPVVLIGWIRDQEVVVQAVLDRDRADVRASCERDHRRGVRSRGLQDMGATEDRNLRCRVRLLDGQDICATGESDDACDVGDLIVDQGDGELRELSYPVGLASRASEGLPTVAWIRADPVLAGVARRSNLSYAG